MTRQVALGAVVAFFATVIALSVWEPKNVIAPTPPPEPAPAAVAPAPAVSKPFRPMMLRPQGVSQTIRAPVVVAQPVDAVAQPVDAGTP